MKTLHIFPGLKGNRTLCKRTFISWGSNTGGVMLEALLEHDPYYPRPGEKLCEECVASDVYQEELALYLLATAGEV